MQNFDLIDTLAQFARFFIPFLFALSFHEFAHGWVARLKGDRTAEVMGRLTMNPFSHADPIGTFALPLISMVTHVPLLGWAKPVPVDPRNLKRPKQDMFWIAAAGPLSNILLAVLGTIGIAVILKTMTGEVMTEGSTVNTVAKFLSSFILVNMVLAVLNLLPIHPLDGGKILARFLPDRLNQKLEDMQMMTGLILMGFFLIGGFRIIAIPAQFATNFLLSLAESVV